MIKWRKRIIGKPYLSKNNQIWDCYSGRNKIAIIQKCKSNYDISGLTKGYHVSLIFNGESDLFDLHRPLPYVKGFIERVFISWVRTSELKINEKS